MNTICPDFASLLINGQQVTHHHHMRGWLETPDGRFFQPKASEVQFIKGRRIPFFVSSRTRRRWFSGHDADLVLVMDCQIPTDDLIVHDL